MNFLRKSNNYKRVIVKSQIEELSKNLLLQVARLPAESSDEHDTPPKLPELLSNFLLCLITFFIVSNFSQNFPLSKTTLRDCLKQVKVQMLK